VPRPEGGKPRPLSHYLDFTFVGREAALELGASVLGYASSGLPGPKGNLETFVWLAEGERGGVHDLERTARVVEP